MLDPEASEVVTLGQTAMLAGMPYAGLCDAVLTDLTMAERLVLLFGHVPPASNR